MQNSYNILIVSSRPPGHFAGMGTDLILSLTNRGHKVDFLTRYKTDENGVIGLVESPKDSWIIKHRELARRLIPLPIRRFLGYLLDLYSNYKDRYIRGAGRIIVSPDENAPVFSNGVLLNAITKPYDFIIIFVWQDMITAASLRAIYSKVKAPIFILSPDMQPFTGGCYYFGDCFRFEQGCGCCPILRSSDGDDLTHKNYVIKKEIYSSIPCYFMSNTYVNGFAIRSGIFKRDRILWNLGPFDENVYKPLNRESCRDFFNIPSHVKYVIFSRFAGLNQTVKGYDYLLSAINKFASTLCDEEKNSVLMLFAGTQDVQFEKKFKVPVMNVGLLSRDNLVKAYSLSSVFVSSSIDEAGPSMMVQSMLCGTPCVAFNIGSSLDLIENGITGYKANYKDIDDFSQGIRDFYSLPETSMSRVRENCRNKAVSLVSMETFSNRIVGYYERIVAKS